MVNSTEKQVLASWAYRGGRCVPAAILLAFVNVTNALASPEINVSEAGLESEQGDNVTIKGSGFGEGSDAEPLLWHRVDDAEAYSGLGNGEKIPVGEGEVWESGSASNKIVINRNDGDQRHSYSTANYESPGGNSFVGNPTAAGGSGSEAATDELFFSYWIKFDRDPYERNSSASHKFTRVWGGGNDDLRVSWVGWGLTLQNENAGGNSAQVAYSEPNPNESVWEANRWHLHEVWVSPKDGRVQTYVDGKLRNDWADSSPNYLKTQHPSGPRIALLGFNPSHGDGIVSQAKFYMDDIMVSHSRARVLLSNADSWADSTNHEYQEVKKWDDNNIEFKLNFGALNEDSGIYVYVVNDRGEVNEEGVAMECPKCPEKTELQVE